MIFNRHEAIYTNLEKEYLVYYKFYCNYILHKEYGEVGPIDRLIEQLISHSFLQININSPEMSAYRVLLRRYFNYELDDFKLRREFTELLYDFCTTHLMNAIDKTNFFKIMSNRPSTDSPRRDHFFADYIALITEVSQREELKVS